MDDQYGILTKEIIKLTQSYPDNFNFMNKINSLVLTTAKNLNKLRAYVKLGQLGKINPKNGITRERLQAYEEILAPISDPIKNEYLWFRGELNRIYILTINYEHAMNRKLEIKKDA